MKLPEKIEALLRSGRATDLVLGVQGLIGLGFNIEEIVAIVKYKEKVSSIPPFPLVLIDGYQIAATVGYWVVKPHSGDEGKEREWKYTEGYRFDLRKNKQNEGQETSSNVEGE